MPNGFRTMDTKIPTAWALAFLDFCVCVSFTFFILYTKKIKTYAEMLL